MDDALDKALERPSRRRRDDTAALRRSRSQGSHSATSSTRRNNPDSDTRPPFTTASPPRPPSVTRVSSPRSNNDDNADIIDEVLMIRQSRRERDTNITQNDRLSVEMEALHLGVAHQPQVVPPSYRNHHILERCIPNRNEGNNSRRNSEGNSSTTTDELRALQQQHDQQEEMSTGTHEPAHITIPLRSHVSTSDEDTQTMQLPFHPPSPRAARGEAKYRTPKPESQLRRLPRGFVWTDPDCELERNIVSQPTPEVAAPRFCGVRVPENTVYIVERAGVFHRVLEPGFRLVVPRLDRVSYVFSKKMQKLCFATSNVITADRVALTVNTNLFYTVDDPVTAAYAVESVSEALVDVAAAAIHDEFARVSVDVLFSDLETMWGKIAHQLNVACRVWGSRVIRLFTSIQLPPVIAKTYERLAQLRLQREIQVTQHQNRELLKEAENERNAVTAEGRAIVATNESVAERDAITMKGEANAQALQSIAEALEKPSGRDAAKVWIASKYIDALAIGFRSNKGTVSIDAAGPARIVDEALNIMDAQIHRSRRHSPSSPLSRSNRRRNTPAQPQSAVRQENSNPNNSRSRQTPTPSPPTVTPPPSRRWPSLDSNNEENPLNSSSLPPVQARRTRSGGSARSADGFSIGGSRYFNDNFNQRGGTNAMGSPRMLPLSSKSSPRRAAGMESPKPPRPPRRSRHGSLRSYEGITAADFLAMGDTHPRNNPGGAVTERRNAEARRLAERRSSGAALEQAGQTPTLERRGSGSEDTMDRGDISDNVERIGSTGTSTGDQAGAGNSPAGGATFISQVSEADDDIMTTSEAMDFTIAEVRAEMASPGALGGWDGLARKKLRRKGSNGSGRTRPSNHQMIQQEELNKSPNASSMTEDGEVTSSSTPLIQPQQVPMGTPERAKLEFRRRKRGSPKMGGVERRNGS